MQLFLNQANHRVSVFVFFNLEGQRAYFAGIFLCFLHTFGTLIEVLELSDASWCADFGDEKMGGK